MKNQSSEDLIEKINNLKDFGNFISTKRLDEIDQEKINITAPSGYQYQIQGWVKNNGIRSVSYFGNEAHMNSTRQLLMTSIVPGPGSFLSSFSSLVAPPRVMVHAPAAATAPPHHSSPHQPVILLCQPPHHDATPTAAAYALRTLRSGSER